MPLAADPPPPFESPEAWERRFVRERRARGVAWSHIAQMLGRPAADVRRQYDPPAAELEA